MFEIKVEDARFWKSCIDSIVNLIDEGVVEINKESVDLKAVDPSQIAMVIFSAPKSAFATYDVKESLKVGLNFDSLSKIFARARGKETLNMSLEENKLSLEFVSGNSKRSFKVPLLDLPAAFHKEPKIEHSAVIKLNSTQFKEILRDVALISSHLTLEANADGFSVEAHGDSADLKVESEKTAEAITEISVKEPAKATFPLQYMDDICKACPENSPLTINLKTNAPVKVAYSVGEASLVYYLAPRIETE